MFFLNLFSFDERSMQDYFFAIWVQIYRISLLFDIIYNLYPTAHDNKQI